MIFINERIALECGLSSGSSRISTEAKENPRLRQNFDLRISPNDMSQRMLNALLPGTVVPIHQHEILPKL